MSANDKFSAGIITLEVGALTEEVSVSGRVSELQATSGERSFTLESEALKNIANNGRQLFNFANARAGRRPERHLRHRDRRGERLHRERPAAELQQHDDRRRRQHRHRRQRRQHGHHQHRRGRASSRSSRTPTRPSTAARWAGSCRWSPRAAPSPSTARATGTAGAPTGTRTPGRNKRAGAPPPVGNGAVIEPAKASRNDYGYTIGGPIFIPGVFNEDKKKLFFFWSQEFQNRSDPTSERQARVPTALERAGRLLAERRQQRQPVPLHPRLHDRPALQRGATRAAASQDGGVLGRIPANRLYAPGINALNIYPAPNFTAGSGINYTSQTPNSRRGARTCCGSTSRPRTSGASRAAT